MNIEKNKVVEVSYELTVDGQIIDVASKEQPLDYIHGMKMLIPRFEAEIEGKEPGDAFAFEVSPAEGYGEYDPARVIKLSRSAFEIDGKVREDLLEVGRQLPMYNKNGHVEYARITEVREDGVMMDFNHDLAGKTLYFKGEILSVRDATEKELKEGLHGEFLPIQECGCGCHGHHGDGGGCHGHHGDGGGCHGHHHGDGCCHDPHHGDCCGGGHGDGCCRGHHHDDEGGHHGDGCCHDSQHGNGCGHHE